MTTTQAICESMGWRIWQNETGGPFSKKFYHVSNNKYHSFYSEYSPFDINKDCTIEIAKLLQSRLVEEGWSISVHQLHDPREDGKPFMAYGYKADGQNVSSEWTASEPSAILALYCKIHGIEVDK
jgi:hypothetical protein